MKRVYDFLKNAQTYYLATMDGDQPRVRPFGTILIFEDKLYIQTGKGKDVAKQMNTNGNIEISAMYQGEWIRVTGKVTLDERVEVQEAMLDAYPDLRAMYTTGPDGNTAVYYMEHGKAIICSFANAPIEIEF